MQKGGTNNEIAQVALRLAAAVMLLGAMPSFAEGFPAPAEQSTISPRKLSQ